MQQKKAQSTLVGVPFQCHSSQTFGVSPMSPAALSAQHGVRLPLDSWCGEIINQDFCGKQAGLHLTNPSCLFSFPEEMAQPSCLVPCTSS